MIRSVRTMQRSPRRKREGRPARGDAPHRSAMGGRLCTGSPKKRRTTCAGKSRAPSQAVVSRTGKDWQHEQAAASRTRRSSWNQHSLVMRRADRWAGGPGGGGEIYRSNRSCNGAPAAVSTRTGSHSPTGHEARVTRLRTLFARDAARRRRRAEKQRRRGEAKELARQTEISIERGYGARY